jgi:multidrug transporter EmrE-like cation transporter
MIKNLLIAALYGFIAQIGTFIQLQGNAKYNWIDKYPVLLLSAGIPLSWMYIQSVKHFILAYNGQIWPSRLIGFGIGIIVFSTMSYLMFKEPFTLKTFLSLTLALGIILIQVFIK